jgi:hypothetical protein
MADRVTTAREMAAMVARAVGTRVMADRETGTRVIWDKVQDTGAKAVGVAMAATKIAVADQMAREIQAADATVRGARVIILIQITRVVVMAMIAGAIPAAVVRETVAA